MQGFTPTNTPDQPNFRVANGYSGKSYDPYSPFTHIVELPDPIALSREDSLPDPTRLSMSSNLMSDHGDVHMGDDDDLEEGPILEPDHLRTHDVQDFLSVVGNEDLFQEDALLMNIRYGPPDDVSESTTVARSVASATARPEELGEALRNFKEYWLDAVKRLGPQPTIEIQLKSAYAKVTALRPRSEKRLDNMWTPITRCVRNCFGHNTTSEISVFKNFNAVFCPGKMTLLVGAPGSGKSTLLKMIAGRLATDSHWETGGVYINGKSLEDSKLHPARYIALVDETDLHLPKMTVEQTLRFAYECNSVPSMEGGNVNHVKTIMEILGLSHVAETVVGDENVRGCSGGEKRRVTVGEQWAANVRVLLADRLTDGLDSQATLDIIRALKVWSSITNATVVLSLLQPPPEVYKYFDDVCILQRTVTVDDESCNLENPMFIGPLRNARQKMHSMGYEEEATVVRQQGGVCLESTLGTAVPGSLISLDISASSPYKRNYQTHLWLLVKRQFRLEFFNWGLLISRILLNTINGLATSSIFITSDDNQTALRIRTALMFHSCISVVIGVVSHIGLFCADRPVFYKQRAAFFFHSSSFWIAHNLFQVICWGLLESFLLSVTTYWIGGLRKEFTRFLIFWMALYLLNLISSVVFKVLAILCSSVSVAQAWAGLVQVVFFVFSGFLQPWPVLPSGWKWGPYISPQSYSFSILLINEFSGSTYNCTAEELLENEGICPYTLGDDWLRNVYDIDAAEKTNNIGFLFFCMLAWFVVYFILGAVALRYVQWRHRIMHRLKAHTPQAKKHYVAVPSRVTLSWHNITYEVKKKDVTQALLTDISGIVRPKTMTALMGPSGAGKTTLLDVVAGRKTGGTITGEIVVNGHPKEQKSFSRVSGYVEQMNTQIESLTVLEALEFSAKLRLPENVVREHHTAFIETVINMLQLYPVAHEQIRDILLDQKKRVAVGVEVVASPSVLFLDEPTTGLDSMGALVLVQALALLRDQMEVAIVCTIHQPSKDLFWMFDRLLLLAKGGRLVYTGNLGNNSTTFLSYLQGIPEVKKIRSGENPASWMLEQIGGGVSPDLIKVSAIVEHWNNGTPAMELERELAAEEPGVCVEARKTYATGPLTQLRVLTVRAFRIYWRSPAYNLVRTILVVVLALLLGTVFFQLEYNQTDIWSRLSWCYTACFYVGLTFLLSGVTLLMPLRPAYYRERAANTYSSWAYGVSLFVAELPYVTMNSLLVLVISWFFATLYVSTDDNTTQFGMFWKLAVPFWAFLFLSTIVGHCLSAISPSLEVANAIGPGLGSWFSSFAGFYLPRPWIPMGYVWIYWLNPFRYAYEAFVIAEFKDKEISCDGYLFLNASGLPLCSFKDGNAVIEYMGMFTWGYGMDLGVVFAYIAAFMLATLLGLRFLRFGSK